MHHYFYLLQEEEADEPVAVKTIFNVKINKFDESKKVALIKEIKNVVEGLNLVQVGHNYKTHCLCDKANYSEK